MKKFLRRFRIYRKWEYRKWLYDSLRRTVPILEKKINTLEEALAAHVVMEKDEELKKLTLDILKGMTR
jgi:hypothetical protein